MVEPSPNVTRRTAIATVVGGATVATAMAQSQPGTANAVLASFADAFSSPFFSLERGDETAWAAEVGTVFTVQGGPSLQVTGIETFARYGRTAANLIRSRAFLVNFAATDRGRIVGDTIYRVTHPRFGSFDLFLKTTPELPTFAQAVFN